MQRPMMPALPYILSPYLRPLLDTGILYVDDAISGSRTALPGLQEQIVKALWQPLAAPAQLRRLIRTYGQASVDAAISALIQQNILFNSLESCERHTDHILSINRPSIPYIDQIELTNPCPMHCTFCPRGIAGQMKRPTGMMSFELYQKLLDQMHPRQAAYRPLELHHLGESLLHPQIDRFIEEASLRNLPTEISLNPSLLLPDLMKKLLNAGLSRIVLSLDALDDKLSIAIRGPASRYSVAEKNIEALLTYAGTIPKAPRIVIQMLDLSKNRHQHALFLERYARLHLPYIEAYIKPLDGPDPDDSLSKPEKPPLRYCCTYPFRSVVVLWDGRIVPCCRDDDAKLILGDLNTQTLQEIWEGEPARHLREAHIQRDIKQGHLCDGCGWRRDIYAAAMAERDPGMAQKEPLGW